MLPPPPDNLQRFFGAVSNLSTLFVIPVGSCYSCSLHGCSGFFELEEFSRARQAIDDISDFAGQVPFESVNLAPNLLVLGLHRRELGLNSAFPLAPVRSLCSQGGCQDPRHMPGLLDLDQVQNPHSLPL